MKNILVIEDEEAAVRRLSKMMLEIMPDANILPALPGIASAVEWFKNNPAPDLILSDVHLADGQSFEIFRQVHVPTPIPALRPYRI